MLRNQKGSPVRSRSKYSYLSYMLHLLPEIFFHYTISTFPVHSSSFFSKPSPKFLCVSCGLCYAGSCVDPQNQTGHPAHCHRQLMQVPVLSAHGILNRLQNMCYDKSDRCLSLLLIELAFCKQFGYTHYKSNTQSAFQFFYFTCKKASQP